MSSTEVVPPNLGYGNPVPGPEAGPGTDAGRGPVAGPELKEFTFFRPVVSERSSNLVSVTQKRYGSCLGAGEICKRSNCAVDGSILATG